MPEISHKSSMDKPPLAASVLNRLQTDAARQFHRGKHLVDIDRLAKNEIEIIIETARDLQALIAKGDLPVRALTGINIATLFYESSTRTRSSFELAARNLDCHVLHLDINSSSVAKGETLDDTARTLSAMGVSALIQRHSQSGSAQRLTDVVPSSVSIVNAGDGWNSHPTQALLDFLTMSEVAGSMQGRKVVIVGDIKHSRVARSNIHLLNKFGVDIHVCGPPPLMPSQIEGLKVTVHTRLEKALKNADFVMALRLQKERQQQGLITSTEDYAHLYRIDHKRLSLAAPGVRVMHPGPINRGVEITGALADDPALSLISTQVTNGIAVRMAVLLLLLKGEDNLL